MNHFNGPSKKINIIYMKHYHLELGIYISSPGQVCTDVYGGGRGKLHVPASRSEVTFCVNNKIQCNAIVKLVKLLLFYYK